LDEIEEQVVDILEADRKPQQSDGRAFRRPRSTRAVLDQAFDAAERCRALRSLTCAAAHGRRSPPSRGSTSCAETADHLADRNVMARMA
jgi:hypothetical protein